MKLKRVLASILASAMVFGTMSFTVSAEETKVSTAVELKEALSAGKDIVLANDIDLNNEEWEPISYGGVFNGNGFAIKNLKINKPKASDV